MTKFPSVHKAQLGRDIWDYHHDAGGKGVFLFHWMPGNFWTWMPIYMWN
jgi:hypothetical protein